MADEKNLNVSNPEANTAADAKPGDYDLKTVEVAPGKFVTAKRYTVQYKDEEDEAEKDKLEADDPNYEGDGDPDARPSLDEKIREAEMARDTDGNGIPDCQERDAEER